MTRVPIDQAPAGPALDAAVEMDINQEGVLKELMTYHVNSLKKYGYLKVPNLVSSFEWFNILKPEFPELLAAVGDLHLNGSGAVLYLPDTREKLLAKTRLMIERQEELLVHARQCLEMVEQQRLPHGWPGTEPAK